MFEKLLQKLLKEVAGQFIDGIDLNKLNIGIWSGTVEIFNVSLKPKILAMFGLPYRLLYSNISKLKITIPWKNLFSAPLEVEIESIQILATNEKCILTQEEQSSLILLKLKQFIQKLSQQIAKKIEVTATKDKDKNPTYMETVYAKMIDNLYLTIKNIHFRFQAYANHGKGANFAFGAILETMEIYSVNRKGEKQFIDRSKLSVGSNLLSKKLEVNNLGIYWSQEENPQNLFLNLPMNMSPNKYLQQGSNAKQYNRESKRDIEKLEKYRKMLNLLHSSSKNFNYVLLLNIKGTIQEKINTSLKNDEVVFKNVNIETQPLKICITDQMIKQMLYLSVFTNQILISENVKQIKSEQLSQQFLELLKRYCIGQVKSSDSDPNSKKSVFTDLQQKFFLKHLYSHRNQLHLIKQKVKEIIVINFGEKGSLTKTQIIQSWCKIEAALKNQSQKNKNELPLLNVRLIIPEIAIFYMDARRSPILEMQLKKIEVKVVYQPLKNQQISISMQKLECSGFGGHQVISGRSFHQQKVLQNPFFSLTFSSTVEKEEKKLSLNFEEITFFYDHKVFRQILKISDYAKAHSISVSTTNERISENKWEKQSNFSERRIKANQQNLKIDCKLGKVSIRFSQEKDLLWEVFISKVEIYKDADDVGIELAAGVMENQKKIVSPFNIVVLIASKKNSGVHSDQVLSRQNSQNSQINSVLKSYQNPEDLYKITVKAISIQLDQYSLRNLQRLLKSLKNLKKSDLIYLLTNQPYEINSSYTKINYSQVHMLITHKTKKEQGNRGQSSSKEHWKKFEAFLCDDKVCLFLQEENSPYLVLQQISKIQIIQYKFSKIEAFQIQAIDNITKSPHIYTMYIKQPQIFKQWNNYLHTIIENRHLEPIQSETNDQFVKRKRAIKLMLSIGQIKMEFKYAGMKQIYEYSFQLRLHELEAELENEKIVGRWEEMEIKVRDRCLLRFMKNELSFDWSGQENIMKVLVDDGILIEYWPLQILLTQKIIGLVFPVEDKHQFKISIKPPKAPTSSEIQKSLTTSKTTKISLLANKTTQAKFFNLINQISETDPQQSIPYLAAVSIGNIQTNIIISDGTQEIYLKLTSLSLKWVDQQQVQHQFIFPKQNSINGINLKFQSRKIPSMSKLTLEADHLWIPAYEQQHVLRFIDYVLCQIKDILLQPHQFFIYQQFPNQQINPKSRILSHKQYLSKQFEKQQLQKMCQPTKPGLNTIELHISLREVTLGFIDSCIEGTCENIFITNNKKNLQNYQKLVPESKHFNQSINQNLEFDIFCILFRNLRIQLPENKKSEKNSNIGKIIENLDLLLCVSLFTKPIQYSICHPNFSYQNQINVDLKTIGTRAQLQFNERVIIEQILSVIKKSITFSDSCPESKYSYDTWLREKFSLQTEGSTINFNFEIQDVQFNLIHSLTDPEKILEIQPNKIIIGFFLTPNKQVLSIKSAQMTLFEKNIKILSLSHLGHALKEDFCLVFEIQMTKNKEKISKIQKNIDTQEIQIEFTVKFLEFLHKYLKNRQKSVARELSQNQNEIQQQFLEELDVTELNTKKVRITYHPIQKIEQDLHKIHSICLQSKLYFKQQQITKKSEAIKKQSGQIQEITLFFLQKSLKTLQIIPSSQKNRSKSGNILQISKIAASNYLEYSNNVLTFKESSLKIAKSLVKISLQDFPRIHKVISQIQISMKNTNRLENYEEQKLDFIRGSSRSSDKSSKTQANNVEIGKIYILISSENLNKTGLIPLMCGELKTKIIPMEEKQGEPQVKIRINFSYYNQRIKIWEPLLQQTSLLLAFTPIFKIEKQLPKEPERLTEHHTETASEISLRQISDHSSKNQRDISSASNIKKKKEEYININASTNFIEALWNALKQREKETREVSKRLVSDIEIDESDSWIIVNQLGCDIKCEYQSSSNEENSLEHRKSVVSIKNGKSQKIYKCEQFQKDTIFLSQKNNQSSLPFSSKHSQTEKSMKIDLILDNRLKIKNLQIGLSQMGLKKSIVQIQNQAFFIYRHIYTDISKNVRYIKFYSGVMVINMTKIRLYIDLGKITEQISEGKKSQFSDCEVIAIQPNKQVFLPMKYDRLAHIKGEQFIKNALSKQNPENLQNNFPQNSLNNSFLISRDTRRLRTIFKIYPALKIMNKLPETLSVAIKLDQRIIHSFTLLTDSEQFLYVNMSEELEISFHIEGYQWTDFSKCLQIYEINLFNYTNNSIKIKLSIWREEQGIMSLVAYPVAILYNICDFPLEIEQYDPRNLSKNAKNFPKTIIQPNKQYSLSHDKFLLIKPSKAQKFDKISLLGGNQVQQFLYSLKNTQSEIFEHIVAHQRYLKNQKGNKSINIKYITISSKFIFANKSKFGLLIKKYKGSNKYMRILKPEEELSFCFLAQDFQRDEQKNNYELNQKIEQSSLYQITIMNSDFQWGGAISITQRGKTFGILRSRGDFKNKVLFYYCNIIKFNYMNRFRLQFYARENSFGTRPKEILPEIPIILKNKLPGYDIWLPQYGEQRIMTGEKICFSWDQPILKANKINLIISEGISPQMNFKNFREAATLKKIAKYQYLIDPVNPSKAPLPLPASKKRSSFLFSSVSGYAEINVHHLTQKCCLIEIRPQKKSQNQSKKVLEINLPLCIALINNSFTPAYHLCDLTVLLNIQKHQKLNKDRSSLRSSFFLPINEEFELSESQKNHTHEYKINLKNIQLDNHLKYRVYFPVVLSTSISIGVHCQEDKFGNFEVAIQAEKIFLNLEQDFAMSCYAFASFIMNILQDNKSANDFKGFHDSFENIEGNLFKQKSEQISILQSETLLISKLSLPKLHIKLQVKTNKLSIQTSIVLEEPPLTHYPWPKFPYPISNVIINLLSNLSISPIAIISSFKKGVSTLLSQQEPTKGFEGFFGQIIGAVSNTVSGVIGIVVGHDIEMVEDFFDGIGQGTNMFFKQIVQIKDGFEPQECSAPAILKGLGKGLIGVVFKPIKGLLQMTLKISEGVKKTALYSFESERFYRKRESIVFYGSQQRFYSYNAEQSNYKAILMKSSGESFQYFHITRFFILKNYIQNSTHLLAIGSDKVALIDLKSQKQLCLVHLDTVTRIKLRTQTTIQFQPQHVLIEPPNQQITAEIYELIAGNHHKMFVQI